MRVSVRVKPGARESVVEKTTEGDFLVRVKAPAKENKANREVIETLAGYFGVPKSQVSIITGLTSSRKIIEVKGK